MRTLREIAQEIRKDWQPVNYAAKPYLEAMLSLNSLQDTYYAESADGIVLRFLCNASSWRGETARRIKKELNSMLKSV